MWAQSQRYHTVGHLEAGVVDRGSAQRPSLKGRERPIVSRTNTENRFKGNPGETSEKRSGAHMAFPERVETVLNETLLLYLLLH